MEKIAREQAEPRTDTLVWGKNAVTELLKSGGAVDTVYLADSLPQPVAGYYTALAKQTGAEAVVIDYLGLMKHGDGKSLYERVTATSNGLKRMARNLGIPVLCLCQLNREVESRKNEPPRLSDLRDSGAIEQDADAVLLIHKFTLENENEYDAIPMDLHVAKNRHGKTGKVEFVWYMRNGRMLERR